MLYTKGLDLNEYYNDRTKKVVAPKRSTWYPLNKQMTKYAAIAKDPHTKEILFKIVRVPQGKRALIKT